MIRSRKPRVQSRAEKEKEEVEIYESPLSRGKPNSNDSYSEGELEEEEGSTR